MLHDAKSVVKILMWIKMGLINWWIAFIIEVSSVAMTRRVSPGWVLCPGETLLDIALSQSFGVCLGSFSSLRLQGIDGGYWTLTISCLKPVYLPWEEIAWIVFSCIHFAHSGYFICTYLISNTAPKELIEGTWNISIMYKISIMFLLILSTFRYNLSLQSYKQIKNLREEGVSYIEWASENLGIICQVTTICVLLTARFQQ